MNKAKKEYGYAKQMIYNVPNNMMLYGVDYTSELRDCCLVFMSKEDAESWIDSSQVEEDEYLGYHVSYNPKKEFSMDSQILYHDAERLMIKGRQVWLL